MFCLLLLSLFHVSSADDTVVIPQVDLNWTSQTFIIPPGVFPKDVGDYCAIYSKYYCLNAYETKTVRDPLETHYFGRGYTYQPIMPPDGQDEDGMSDLALEYDQSELVNDGDGTLIQRISTLKSFIYSQCYDATWPMHREHNNFVGLGGCCQYQCDNYLVHGYERLFLTPQEYIDKLTDYSEENKTLNLIEAYFSVNCNHRRNIITKIGFGKGELVRTNYPFGHKPQRFGYPYLLSSSDDSVAYWFPYRNPGSQLTYWFFKNNVLCTDQPWICGISGGDTSRNDTPKRDLKPKREEEEQLLPDDLPRRHRCTIC
ncbi:uncharacterized protein LOC142340857 isoform X2 [Convolutriloba macropyga]|uniref:uncharacterized protein LOC142340857 isoform X2 n=1 Tax=Convolutriloba macropyga TaxID=536237 RepID=UPI003F51E445